MQWKSKNLLTNLPAAKYALLQIGKEDSNGNPAIYFDGNALFRSCIHSRSTLDEKVAGVLIGEIMQWQEAMFLDVRQVREKKDDLDWLLFLQSVQAELTEEQEILGWYYSQPEEDILLTEQVLNLHQTYFSSRKQFLLLLDPAKRRFGVFQQKEGYLSLLPGFKVTSSPKRGEQTKQLLHQIDFNYVQPEAKSTVMKMNVPQKVIQAYQPPKLEDLSPLEEQKAEEKPVEEIAVNLDIDIDINNSYREVFLSKDVLVARNIRSKRAMQQIVAKLLEDMAGLQIKAVLRLYWENRADSDDYFEDSWICQVRWNGKLQKHSIVWNEEEII